MEATKKTQIPAPDAIESEEIKDATPRKLTPTENLILTAKVFAIAGLILAALWGLNTWTAVR